VRGATAFTEQDSGTAEAPIVYRAEEGHTVRLNGGQLLPASAWKPVTDPAILARLPQESRDKVLVADLQALASPLRQARSPGLRPASRQATPSCSSTAAP